MFHKLFLALPLCAACATQMGQVRDTLNEAPDWYAAAREEIRGEGYPEISGVPQVARADRPNLSSQSDLNTDAAEAFTRNPRSADVAVSPADMQVWADGQIARLAEWTAPSNGAITPPRTDAFAHPRARLPR